jgi:hypothetical protein
MRGQLEAPAALPTQEVLPVLTDWESEWASEEVWMIRQAKEPLSLPDIEPRVLGRPARSLVTITIRFPGSMDRYDQENAHILKLFLAKALKMH